MRCCSGSNLIFNIGGGLLKMAKTGTVSHFSFLHLKELQSYKIRGKTDPTVMIPCFVYAIFKNMLFLLNIKFGSRNEKIISS
jgi:hypothetical protein